MSTVRRPYFIISALPADDMAQQDLEIKQVFHMEAEEAREGIEKMQKSLNDNGFDFDCMSSRGLQISFSNMTDALQVTLVSPRLGCSATLDKLDEAEHVDGVIIGFGLRGHPAPSIAIFLEELIEKLRYHPKNVKLYFNWSIPSSLDACQRAMKEKTEKERKTAA